MANIWDLLQARIRASERRQNQGTISSGVVIAKNGTRITVALGASAIDCETAFPGTLNVNDTVWVARGAGVPIILGPAGITAGSQ